MSDPDWYESVIARIGEAAEAARQVITEARQAQRDLHAEITEARRLAGGELDRQVDTRIRKLLDEAATDIRKITREAAADAGANISREMDRLTLNLQRTADLIEGKPPPGDQKLAYAAGFITHLAGRVSHAREIPGGLRKPEQETP